MKATCGAAVRPPRTGRGTSSRLRQRSGMCRPSRGRVRGEGGRPPGARRGLAPTCTRASFRHMSNQPARQRVDLTQFESVEDAVKKVAAAGEYDEIAKHFFVRKGIDPTALPVLFFSSMVNRCNSVHAAIAREMQAQNPHAVFPLIRAY